MEYLTIKKEDELRKINPEEWSKSDCELFSNSRLTIEEKIKRNLIIPPEDIQTIFMDAIRSILLSNSDAKIRTSPINEGPGSDFTFTELKIGTYSFDSSFHSIIMKKDNVEVGKCFNLSRMLDWVAGFTIYLKEKGLIDDFMKYYMFK